MYWFVLNTYWFVLNMTRFVLSMTGFDLYINEFALNVTGFVLHMIHMIAIVLNMTGLVIILVLKFLFFYIGREGGVGVFWPVWIILNEHAEFKLFTDFFLVWPVWTLPYIQTDILFTYGRSRHDGYLNKKLEIFA